ncbi:MAG: fumarate hydratase [Erysipelotrichaceae bacterium]
MKTIQVQKIRDCVERMVMDINVNYPEDIKNKLQECAKKESQPIAKESFRILLENAKIASEEKIPVCQDTGMVIVYMKIGQEVHFVGGELKAAIQEGVASGYEKGYLRKSVVSDPIFKRVNTKDNTPAVIYMDIVEGDQVKLDVSVKGFGSENMSVLKMLKPAQGLQGVKDVIIGAVKAAGPNACPPMVIGVGIGGTFDYAAYMAKHALLRNIEVANQDPLYASLEQELLDEINALNIGPQGLKGDTSALRVLIEQYPTHIAGLPVAVNISCHITRHASEVIA